jgi:hypothetical protein
MTARAVAAPAPVALSAETRDVAVDAKANNQAVAGLTDPGSEHKLHVLLVEDDHATLVFVKALLKSCGHQGAHISEANRSRSTPRRVTGDVRFREFRGVACRTANVGTVSRVCDVKRDASVKA